MKEKLMEKYKYRTEFPALVAEGAPKREVLQDQYDFLFDLWDSPENAKTTVFGNLCFRRKGSSKMIDKFFPLKGQANFNRILQRFDRHKFDQYFSPNVYARPFRKVSLVIMTRLGWCDIDEAEPFAFDPKPSFVWQTSPGRSQAIWRWDRPHSAAHASAFSKALAYRHGGDKGGSAANKLLRLPGSFNHKPGYGKPFIPLVHFDPAPIMERPKLLTGQNTNSIGTPKVHAVDPFAHKPSDVLKKHRRKLSTSTAYLIRHKQVLASDRSNRIFAIVAGLHEAGATRDEIASVLWPNPYFREKYGKDMNALENEISRIIAKIGVAQ